MASIINDIIAPPRRRSRNPTKSTTTGLSKSTPAPAEVPLPPPELAEAVALQDASSSNTPAPAEIPPDAATVQEEAPPATEPVEASAHEDTSLDLERNTPEAEGVLGAAQLPSQIVPQQEAQEPIIESANSLAGSLTIVEPTPIVHEAPNILIGIAGATGAGKIALAQLLSLVLPPSTRRFVLRQNDFFIPKHFLLPRGHDVPLDSDCREAIDFHAMLRVLKYAKRVGNLPPEYDIEDNSSKRGLDSLLVAPEAIKELTETLEKSGALDGRRAVGIVEGFLLYHEPEVRDMLDVKFFLRVQKAKAKASRFGKPEYSLDGEFWTTERYFDGIAWPNYVDEHKPLFENGDVEGMPLFGLCDKLSIVMQPQLGMDLEHILRWAVTSIPQALEQPAGGGSTRDIDRMRDVDPEVSLLKRYEACDCREGWLGRVRKVLYDFV